ncbi:alpha/beta hydrolase (plasmid) [Photobacterium sp. GJ3]|uniref:alpha/beta fold hydrolase n=1 Tax=Photobacterium sp. GJ3 TaxID=2829502 RepID=UPI001B8C8068|nr:alpha/beta hydrolase [Photobacterium sp. GJ3]QUJ70326.1 alpha/beta hydrolase [Photobacterium sp. GJ3]
MNQSHRPIILLRGLLREQRHWGDFVRQLKLKFPFRTVIALDLAGNGQRFLESSPATVSAMVDDLHQQLHFLHARQLEIPGAPDAGTYDLLAISMGGMIALEWARLYPEEVKSLVLLNTSDGKQSPFYKRLRWQQYPKILRLMFSQPSVQEAEILKMTSNMFPDDPDILRSWLKWRKECPTERKNLLRQLNAAATFRYKDVPDKPVLLLASQHDELVDISCSQLLAEHWRCPLHVHPSAGHDLPLDDPEWVCRLALNFWQDIN